MINFLKKISINFSKFSPAAPIGAAGTPQLIEISYLKPKMDQFLKKISAAPFGTAAPFDMMISSQSNVAMVANCCPENKKMFSL